VNNKNDLKQSFKDLLPQKESTIIKPNWVTTEPCGFTSKNTLKTIIEALDSHIIVTEALHIGRSMNLLKKGLSFMVKDKEVNWDWLLRGEGWRWLYDNPSWEWFQKGRHWEHILREDQYFLEKYGFSDLFQDYGVEYVNITDEIWRGRHADPKEIKLKTESKYSPVNTPRMYRFVPRKLYDHVESNFISLARLKQYATYTLKNMFGLIPDPMRPWWHGPDNIRIVSSIIDMNKIYSSIFNVIGVCASIEKTAITNPDGEFEAEYMGNYSIVDGFGFIAMSKDLVYLDSTLLKLTDELSACVEAVNVSPVKIAEKEGLGTYNMEKNLNVKKTLGHWISVD
jgi:uncharacterized protein (DUF362 family)